MSMQKPGATPSEPLAPLEFAAPDVDTKQKPPMLLAYGERSQAYHRYTFRLV